MTNGKLNEYIDSSTANSKCIYITNFSQWKMELFSSNISLDVTQGITGWWLIQLVWVEG